MKVTFSESLSEKIAFYLLFFFVIPFHSYFVFFRQREKKREEMKTKKRKNNEQKNKKITLHLSLFFSLDQKIKKKFLKGSAFYFLRIKVTFSESLSEKIAFYHSFFFVIPFHSYFCFFGQREKKREEMKTKKQKTTFRLSLFFSLDQKNKRYF